MAVEQADIGQRNSAYRKVIEPLLKPVVLAIDKVYPELEADQISHAGKQIVKWGTTFQEYLTRNETFFRNTGIPVGTLSLAAGGVVLTGLSFDLVDGKWARFKRNKIKDRKLIDLLEVKGQSEDPYIDGKIEADQSEQSRQTAKWFNRERGFRAASLTLATNNLPRTAKAIAGMFGISVPESYKPWDLLHFPGTSLGRKLLYAGTFLTRKYLMPNLYIPIQEGVHAWVAATNVIVATERVATIFQPGALKLNGKETSLAVFRVRRLVPQCVSNISQAMQKEAA